MNQPRRLAPGQPYGALIDPAKPLTFTFDGRAFQGFQGDTLASALLANGVRLVGRSFKYHRPRGIFGLAGEEPNALVQLGLGARTEPNLRATQVELFSGLTAASQNRWPSLAFDIGAVNSLFSGMMPAGFYYKTFMQPVDMWMVYEHFIRRAAGLGRAPKAPDPDTYEHRYHHTDVLVAGGGPAGLAAALAAARAGARVMIVTESPHWGGRLKDGGAAGGQSGAAWAKAAADELAGMENVVMRPRTLAAFYYDHNHLVLHEKVTDHLAEPPAHTPRQRLWQVHAARVVLAAGAVERPLVFANNDLPGVMSASAAQAYARRYGVLAGRRAVVFANNDTGYAAALDLHAAGVEIAAVVDPRIQGGAFAAKAQSAGIEVLTGHVIAAARGRRSVTGAEIMAYDAAAVTGAGVGAVTGDVREISCDLILVSGGWTPSVHLHSQAKGGTVYDETLTAFIPGASRQANVSAGACAGTFALSAALAEGFKAGQEAAKAQGFDKPAGDPPTSEDSGENWPSPAPMALWDVPPPPMTRFKRFVDLQNDVTAADVALAHRENYQSVEHLKRYTTLGMGTDQGRTSNINGLAIMAGLRGVTIPEAGHTTFRPPFQPVTMGAVTGDAVGDHFEPIRRTGVHDWHKAHGAKFIEAGLWRRADYYPEPGETKLSASLREAKAVRAAVGLCDVSTLGKIDLQGPDAAEFLNRLYINGFSKLPAGKARYGVMLREDGHVFDDGTVTRLDETRYLITTTTANAGGVLQHMEYYAQTVWPELDVHMVSVTEEWAAVAVAGPNSRYLLERAVTEIDLSNEAFPFMAYAPCMLGDIPARLFRISFSGELAYEIAVPADYGGAAWEILMRAGREYGVTPYGAEALGILRIEKGHVVSGELNGRATPGDLGFEKMISTKKEFIGRRMLAREGLQAADRKQLVGLKPVDGASEIPRGAQLVANPNTPPPVDMEGEVTSNCISPHIGPVALGILRRGRERHGEKIFAHSPVTRQTVEVEIRNPHFIDPEGERLRV
ncbi:MAG: sarcosine oxidase subunit alpha family protein [Rhodospirillales bacterium]